jgi:hypothetical protein
MQKRLAGISRVRSNLKRHTDLVLESLVVLVGPNESFKSTVPQSIELCLTRSLTVETKTYKQTHKLIELSCEPEAGLQVTCQSASGSAYYAIRRENGKTRMEPTTGPWTGDYAALSDAERALIFPTSHARDLLSFDPRKLREALVRIFVTNADTKPPLGLSPLQRKMWEEGLASSEGDSGTRLEKLSEWARSNSVARSKKANADEKRLSETKEMASVAGLEILPGLERQLLRAQAYALGETDRVRKRELESEIQRLETEGKTIAERISALGASKKASHTSKESTYTAEVEAGRTLQKAVIEAERLHFSSLVMQRAIKEGKARHPGRCIFNHPAPNEAEIEAFVDGRVLAREKTYTESVTKHAEAKGKQDKAQEELNSSDRSYDAEIERLKQQTTTTELAMARAELAGLTKRLANAPETWTGQSVEELAARVETLKDASKAKDRYEAGMAAVFVLREEAEACRKVAEKAQDMLAEILASIKTTAEDEVNSYIPTADKASLELEDGGCEWRLLGRDGRSHSQIALSGFQYGILKLALAATVAARTPLSILRLDDTDLVGFDAENIIWLMEQVARMQIEGKISQAIIVTNREDLISRFPSVYQIVRCADTRAKTVDTNVPALPISLEV